MLDAPLTVGNVLLINVATVLPIIALLFKGLWYLSRMTHQHDQMWSWFSGWTQDRREADLPVAHDRRR